MIPAALPDPLAAACAAEIRDGFAEFHHDFREITDRAGSRFAGRDWRGLQLDSQQRLELYASTVERVRTRVARRLGDWLSLPIDWQPLKRAYSAAIAGEDNEEIARTFFNSVSRRVLDTVGVNPDAEFLASEPVTEPSRRKMALWRRYRPAGDTEAFLRRMLGDHLRPDLYRDLDGDARRAAQAIDRQLAGEPDAGGIEQVDLLQPVFYRGKGAYLVGRLQSGNRNLPLVLALLNGDDGVQVDAALLAEDEVSILFSFTRSYFHVSTDRPGEIVAFLKSIVPLKPVHELYSAIGFHKHGKSELYRSLRQHLEQSDDHFRCAEGDVGMVMLVFTLAQYDVVLKVIRDRFARPKTTTRRDVVERYRLVFQHDRVGRLIDAQEFEHLRFPRDKFGDEILEQLLAEAGSTVELRGDDVVLRHVYIERKVVPLNLFLTLADPAAAERAVLDYGRAIKELAAADIFPGDFLIKNFGVTRHGRVVFYDYDELCRLADCRFRSLPPPRTPEDELSAEPWFTVAENDIFPEEFRRFLGMPRPLRDLFVERHAELFDVAFWRDLQRRHGAGEIVDVYPYPRRRRLAPA